MLRLLATILINNSGLIFKYVKIMNNFTCAEEDSKSVVVVLKSITRPNQHLT